jgi:hypothetical protein
MRLAAGRRLRRPYAFDGLAGGRVEHDDVATGDEREDGMRVLAIEQNHVRPDGICAGLLAT